MFLIFLETYCREAEAPCLKHCRAEPEAFTKMNHWPSLIFLIQIAAISKQDSGLFTFRFWWRDESDGSYVFIGQSGLFLDLLDCLLNGKRFQQSLIALPQDVKVFLEISY